jgi:polyisoprenoid-binding protein YceI
MKRTNNVIQRATFLAGLLAVALLAFPARATNDNPTGKKPTVFTVDAKKSLLAWHGKKVTGEHNGTVELNKGSLVFDGNKLTGGQIEVDMTTLKNNDVTDEGYNKKLVGHLKSDDFFHVEKYPTATLTITNVKPKGGTSYEVTADLTIRGKTAPVTFPATVTLDGKTATANATVVVDRSKYDVKYGSKSFFENIGDKMIYDEFDLKVALVATK